MSPADTRPRATEIDRHLAARLREARLHKGWTQGLLADAIGVTFQQVQKYERATNRIAASRLWQIALALDLPAAWFYEGLPTAPGAPAPVPLERPRQSLELLRHFEALTMPLRDRIFSLTRTLARAGQEAEEEQP